MRISCPPTISPCFYGVDTPRRAELIAATHTLEEIRKYIEADSLRYLSLEGRRVVLIDDSIVRGTTSRKLVKMIKAAGAREVHMRISCPPTISPCFYGVDTPRRAELIAATHTLEEIRKYIEADSLRYLSLEGLLEAVNSHRESYCTSCYTGRYPLPFPRHEAEALKLEAGNRS